MPHYFSLTDHVCLHDTDSKCGDPLRIISDYVLRHLAVPLEEGLRDSAVVDYAIV